MRIINGLGNDPSIRGSYGQKAAERWKEHKKTGGGDGGSGQPVRPPSPFDSINDMLGDLLGIGGGAQPQRHDPVSVQYSNKPSSSHKTLTQVMADDTFAFVREDMGEWDNDGKAGISQEEFAAMHGDKIKNPASERFSFLSDMASKVIGSMGGLGNLFGGNDQPPPPEFKTDTSDIPDMLDPSEFGPMVLEEDKVKAEPITVNTKDTTEGSEDGNKDKIDFSGLFDDMGDLPFDATDIDFNSPEEGFEIQEQDLVNMDDPMSFIENLANGTFQNFDPAELMGKAKDQIEAQHLSRAFNIQDLNDDGTIDEVERAAVVLFTDDVVNNTPEELLRTNMFSDFDGILTESERYIADRLLLESPVEKTAAAMKQILQQIKDEADLEAKYADFIGQ